MKAFAFWTNDEIKKLRELYPYYENKQLVEEFPNHTLKGIRYKAESLGIRKINHVDKKSHGDLAGKKFGKWNVIAKHEWIKGIGSIWDCVCDCQMCKPEKEREHYYHRTQTLVNSISKMCPDCFRVKNMNYKKLNDCIALGTIGNGSTFYINSEDVELISKYAWSETHNGYLVAYVNGKHIRMHRLIYETHNHCSIMDNFVIDHINGNPKDNRIENLRAVTVQQNSRNLKLYKTNKSGHKGVSWRKDRNKWDARITVDHHVYYLGLFENYEDAVTAREVAEAKYFGEFSRDKEFLSNKGVM